MCIRDSSYTTTATFAAVPVTTLNNTGDYTALYSCMGAGLVPAAITSSEENTQVQQLSPSRSLLLDIMWSSGFIPVSYTHLRAHETPEHLVCRLLLEKKKKPSYKKAMVAAL
eukprot:TRINITY_DN42368_c0_g1_i1.p1 TRINITY_DN42368_c0_g1~~TRINITY_DN42368_c0_g1_i1.p1  ORF type:complete len:112 (+),score=36.58 TRINITY_DN42368_c0_g1_i1:132-467(+)